MTTIRRIRAARRFWATLGLLSLLIAAPAAASLWYFDLDQDGHGDPDSWVDTPSAPPGYVALGDDCNDLDETIYPDAPELCDGLDNDCDMLIDESCQLWFRDADLDGFGDDTIQIYAPTQPDGFVDVGGDCDDTRWSVHPGAAELCDGLDNNCDGQTDEGCLTWYFDGDGDGYGNDFQQVLATTQPPGYVAEGADCDDTRADMHPGAVELCDGVDNDCNGQTDETCQTWFYDADDDGYGDPDNWLEAATQPLGYVADPTDCDDTDAAIHPGAPELCDGRDNDCNGSVDDACLNAWYRDADDDGYGDPDDVVYAADPPAGYVGDDADCDDADATVHPFACELCDGKDNDCDGTIDQDCGGPWWRDADLDGYGDPLEPYCTASQPPDYADNDLDCDDSDPDTYPGAPELCDGRDNDCNGLIDDGALLTWYRDADWDGYGDANDSIQSCDWTEGYVDNADDCDDTNPDISPGVRELCNGIDDDCDGEIDEAPVVDGPYLLYLDQDNDTWGGEEWMFCTEPLPVPVGFATRGGDCADDNPAVYPGAVEVCDGVDNDCNGEIDEGLLVTWYPDYDQDGFGTALMSQYEQHLCPGVPPQYPDYCTANNLDCDDGDDTVYPGAPEICDGKDNDCNGLVDEGLAVAWYPDYDQDGYGSPAPPEDVQLVCPGDQPANPDFFVTNADDCDDTRDDVHPGATDVCDFADNDCDGEVDEDCDGLSILSIRDVGNDQGRNVRVRWSRHLLETPGADPSITWYTLYRRIDAWKSAGGTTTPEPIPNAPPGDWDWVATLPATGQDVYSLVAPTLCDSTDAGICWSVFFVRVHTADTFVYFDAPPDSGYSIDNLFPSAPEALAAAYAPDRVTLSWQPAAIPDLRQYRIYRGTGEVPLDAEHLLGATTQPGWVDPVDGGWDFAYRVTTVDLAGNESDAAEPLTVTGVDGRGDTPTANGGWSLLPPAPNPFNPSTTLSYDVPTGGGEVRLRIFDLVGREVRTLVGEFRPAGRHQIVWDGTDRDGRTVPSGVYLCRMTAGGRSLARTVVLAK